MEQTQRKRSGLALFSDLSGDPEVKVLRVFEVTEAAVEHTQTRGQDVALEPLSGSLFKAVVSVKTHANAANGTPLTGRYALAVKEVWRLNGKWKVEQGIHWEELPDGVVDAKVKENLEFENYVAKYRALPPKTAAPEIEFTTVRGDKKMKLSDFKGKVVVLDFWATWCGPCQEPMAELQKLRSAHSDWGDKVVVIPVSIDDEMKIVRNHLEKRGWTNTFNVWAGEGGWRSLTAKTFRVTSVPTSYVVSPGGRITWSGHPSGDRIANEVRDVLKQ